MRINTEHHSMPSNNEICKNSTPFSCETQIWVNRPFLLRLVTQRKWETCNHKGQFIVWRLIQRQVSADCLLTWWVIPSKLCPVPGLHDLTMVNPIKGRGSQLQRLTQTGKHLRQFSQSRDYPSTSKQLRNRKWVPSLAFIYIWLQLRATFVTRTNLQDKCD